MQNISNVPQKGQSTKKVQKLHHNEKNSVQGMVDNELPDMQHTKFHLLMSNHWVRNMKTRASPIPGYAYAKARVLGEFLVEHFKALAPSSVWPLEQNSPHITKSSEFYTIFN